MEVRILSALVGIVILVLVLVCPWVWVFTLAAGALAVIAVWELLHNTGIVKSKLFTVVSMIMVALSMGVSYFYDCTKDAYFGTWLWDYESVALRVLLLMPVMYGVVALICWLIDRKNISFTEACSGYLLTLYPALGFGALAALRMEGADVDGLVLVLLMLIIPWMSDTGAYFTGYFFGKHKMAPVISPKKTWEGFFGGWAVSVGCAALFAVICNALLNDQGLYYSVATNAIIAFVLAPLSVCGDLLASLIKRRTGIKDYGNIMPGHGGVMDRFDSVVLIAPLMCLILNYESVIVDWLQAIGIY